MPSISPTPLRTCAISSSSDIELAIGGGRRLFVLSKRITESRRKGSAKNGGAALPPTSIQRHADFTSKCAPFLISGYVHTKERRMVTRAALILLCLGLAAGAQSKPKTPAQGAAPKTASKGAPAKAAPTAIIHTSAGDLKCSLLPAQA